MSGWAEPDLTSGQIDNSDAIESSLATLLVRRFFDFLKTQENFAVSINQMQN